ncbi:MAG TPA: Uma2 family endonuclease [Segetibacter sp.]|jgi:Uma2 family endonuclease
MRRRAEKYIPTYTYSEWLHWEERGELIEGAPIPKNTRIGPKHEKAVADFKTAFTTALAKVDIKNCNVGEPIDYKIANDIILRPDVFIVCGKINKTYLDFPPVIIVEVISKATEERDRGIKFESYEKHGVKYYLIADAMKKSVEIYLLADGKYQPETYKGDFEFDLGSNYKLSVQLGNVFL